MPERETLYRVLQVDPAASPLVIQAAYRVLARVFHPDVEGDDEQMKRLNHAWAILGNPRLRAEYDRQLAGRHPGPTTPQAPASTTAARPSPTPKQADHAGPPQGEPSGPLLTFGRYEGWTIGQVARVDPPFLEWLRRVPAGRQLKEAIDVALQRADGARRMGLRTAAAPTNNGSVHTWMPGASTKLR